MLQHNFLIRCGLSMNILLAFRYKVLFSSRFKKVNKLYIHKFHNLILCILQSLPRMATQQQPQKGLYRFLNDARLNALNLCAECDVYIWWPITGVCGITIRLISII